MFKAVKAYHREKRILQDYHIQVERARVISAEEQVRLVELFQKTGDVRYRNRVVTANLRWAARMAYGYKGTDLPILDLIQVANLALIRSVNTYRSEKGRNVLSWGQLYIRTALREFVKKNRLEDFRIDISSDSDVGYLRSKLELILLDSCFFDKEDFIENFIERMSVAQIYNIVRDVAAEVLEGRERVIFRRLFLDFDQPTQAQVAREIGISRERLRQQKNEIIEKVRKWVKIYLDKGAKTFYARKGGV